jgi:hypothetical protein
MRCKICVVEEVLSTIELFDGRVDDVRTVGLADALSCGMPWKLRIKEAVWRESSDSAFRKACEFCLIRYLSSQRVGK